MSVDQRLLEVEREIKRVRSTPKEKEIRLNIEMVKTQTQGIEEEIAQIKKQPTYLGKAGHLQV